MFPLESSGKKQAFCAGLFGLFAFLPTMAFSQSGHVNDFLLKEKGVLLVKESHFKKVYGGLKKEEVIQEFLQNIRHVGPHEILYTFHLRGTKETREFLVSDSGLFGFPNGFGKGPKIMMLPAPLKKGCRKKMGKTGFVEILDVNVSINTAFRDFHKCVKVLQDYGQDQPKLICYYAPGFGEIKIETLKGEVREQIKMVRWP